MHSVFDLKGKVALVTGSTRGIGKSIAEELGRAGASVCVSSRKADAVEAAVKDLSSQGLAVIGRPCNVSRKEELQALVDATLAKWGRIDVVVANAANNPYYGPLASLPDAGGGRHRPRCRRAALRCSRSRAWLPVGRPRRRRRTRAPRTRARRGAA